MHDLDLTVNMLGLCDPSNLLFVLSARSDALFSNYFEDLLSSVVETFLLRYLVFLPDNQLPILEGTGFHLPRPISFLLFL